MCLSLQPGGVLNRKDRALLRAAMEACEQLTRESQAVTERLERERAELLQRLQKLNQGRWNRILMNNEDSALFQAAMEASKQTSPESQVLTERQAYQRGESHQKLQEPVQNRWHRILDQLSKASDVAVALTAIAALVISLIGFIIQSQDRTASAKQQQASFADRVVPWWTMSTSANVNSADLHISNNNPLPVNVWVVHLPEDNNLPPGLHPPLAANKLAAQYSAAGEFQIPPHIFIAEIPPCTTIEVDAPFATLHENFQDSASGIQYGSSLAVGDIVFIDSSGYIWAKSPSGALREVQYSSINGSSENSALVDIVLRQDTGSGPNSTTWQNQHQSSVCG